MAQANWAVRDARERSDTARHQELLDAAARVFVERGYAGATAAAITAEAGVSRPTFYVYFASREEIFAAVAARVRDDFLAAQEPENSNTPAEMLVATVHAFAAAVHAHGPLLTLIEQRALVDPEISALAHEISERPIRRFTKYLEREARLGRISPKVPNRVIAETIGHTLVRGIISRTSRRARSEFEDHMIVLGAQLLGLSNTVQYPL